MWSLYKATFEKHKKIYGTSKNQTVIPLHCQLFLVLNYHLRIQCLEPLKLNAPSYLFAHHPKTRVLYVHIYIYVYGSALQALQGLCVPSGKTVTVKMSTKLKAAVSHCVTKGTVTGYSLCFKVVISEGEWFEHVKKSRDKYKYCSTGPAHGSNMLIAEISGMELRNEGCCFPATTWRIAWESKSCLEYPSQHLLSPVIFQGSPLGHLG